MGSSESCENERSFIRAIVARVRRRQRDSCRNRPRRFHMLFKNRFAVALCLLSLPISATACGSSEPAVSERAPDGAPAATLGAPPFFAAGAIGVGDLERSFDFYSRVLG